jgi:hypothetical protein
MRGNLGGTICVRRRFHEGSAPASLAPVTPRESELASTAESKIRILLNLGSGHDVWVGTRHPGTHRFVEHRIDAYLAPAS